MRKYNNGTDINNEMDITDAYFEKLCNVAGLRNPIEHCGYFEVMHQLFRTEYYWSVPNDDNRGADGLKLRERYGYPEVESECSLLEMLLGLAVRCHEEIMYDPSKDYKQEDWFWMMLTNLGLNRMRDISFGDAWVENDVTGICDVFMDREYARNGRGGLFPLKAPREDQTKVEIWYQLSAYLLENYPIGE